MKNESNSSVLSHTLQLTKAILPDANSRFVPREGFRIDRFRDPITGMKIPMISASIDARHVFDLFLDLLDPLGDIVHVVLETSHSNRDDQHLDLRRGKIDLPVLKSAFLDFEDLIVNDGCTGIAVLNTKKMVEVQIDEHKQIYIFGETLKGFHRVLKKYGIQRIAELSLLSENDHIHHTSVRYAEEFVALCRQLGAGNFDTVLSDGGELFC